VLFDVRDATPLITASLAAEHALLHPGTGAAASSASIRVHGATRVRRMQAAMAFARLRRGGRPLSPMHTLFTAWRAARGHYGDF
jgi:hypothetical protein